ncbi:PQQ-dependent dehydrogenase, methanol/ethanol family [Muriicola sp. Z0-33]|uniref:PQQ-dependent dehydrogenase, methanol/ethanol family n=1 Tax=Muriicola sp. Z0-33 TaxID=2816957 RepID=UPI002237EF99|nr:PQQ-dependent dehydrogenase, methanol/ethanol family [Muriicola sp. Z0-33]MCW5517003.1 PQQ-dependent dehydrogenase, methanol/ethanol family [Muriicola sp. Z0-33]
MKKTVELFLMATTFLFICACASEPEPGTIEHITAVTGEINDTRLSSANDTPGDWITYGKNYNEDRYSPLNSINASNIDSLGLAWSINLGTKRGIEATPIVVDGIMYVTGPWSVVYAIDARTGKLIWTYDPEVPKGYGEKACCDVVNRGVAVYKGFIFVGTLDGRLVAINAATGEKSWEVLTVNQDKAYTITGAPRVIKGKVIIGNGGAEYGVRGYVTAYDALSGDEAWRFYTVPGNPADGFESKAMEDAAKTWTGEWWKFGGGGTAWDAIAYDPELNTVYIGVGNGSPWNRDIRSPEGGDNLYLSSIIALNPDDGSLKWHYQTTPGDTWDYTATQQIILTDLEINGEIRKVLMQAPKNGFFYVIDRVNGDFISAEPYVYVNWAKGIDKETGRPIEAPNSRYPNMNTEIAPSASGGHNWQPMAYSPVTGLVYIPAREFGMFYGQPAEFNYNDDGRSWNIGSEFNAANNIQEDTLARQFYGKLIAWDPINQKEVWNAKQPSPWNAGVLVTDDFVFQGTAEGDLVAFDAQSGAEVWSYPLGTGIIAPPITYEVDGIQYITIPVGWGGVLGLWMKFTEQINPGSIYTFALGKNEPLPDFPKAEVKQLVQIDYDASKKQLLIGEKRYLRYCSQCHGGGGYPQGGGNIPDLRYSTAATFKIMTQIVGEGLFLEKGMPNFGDRLSEEEILNIKYYLLAEADKARAAQ